MKGTPIELGKSVVRTQGKDAVVVAYGSSVNEALAAAALLEQDAVKITVVDARFCKPLDVDMVRTTLFSFSVHVQNGTLYMLYS